MILTAKAAVIGPKRCPSAPVVIYDNYDNYIIIIIIIIIIVVVIKNDAHRRPTRREADLYK